MSKFIRLTKTTLMPLVLCLTILSTSPAIAKQSAPQNSGKMRQILSELSLTEGQKQDVKQIMKQTRFNNSVYKAEQKLLHLKLKRLIQADEWDLQTVKNTFITHQDSLHQKALQRASTKNKVWSILTPTQQAEFIAQLESRKNTVLKTPHKKKENRNANKLKRLKLTEQQQASIKEIRTAANTESKDIKTQLKAFKEAEQKLVQSNDFNVEAWNQLHSKYQNDFQTLAILKAKSKHDVWNQLSPEQQQKSIKLSLKKRNAKKRKILQKKQRV